MRCSRYSNNRLDLEFALFAAVDRQLSRMVGESADDGDSVGTASFGTASPNFTFPIKSVSVRLEARFAEGAVRSADTPMMFPGPLSSCRFRFSTLSQACIGSE